MQFLAFGQCRDTASLMEAMEQPDKMEILEQLEPQAQWELMGQMEQTDNKDQQE